MPTKKRKGGNFFGEGTYGCTFSPPPACIGPEIKVAPLPRNSNQILAKIFAKESDLDKEWDYVQKIANVDPKQEIFLFAASRCQTTKGNVRKDKAAKSCTIVTDGNRSGKTVLHMAKMKFGGMTLEDYVRTQGVSLDQFVNMVLPILGGIRKLIKHKLIHHDLKFDNILYNPNDGGVKVIDFGLMVPLTGVYNPVENHYLNSKYWLHPPEYRIAQFILDNPRVYRITKDIGRQEVAEVIRTLKVHFDENTGITLRQSIIDEAFRYQCDYEEAFIKYFKAVFNKRQGAAALDYMAKYANKVDIYSFGITLAYLSTYIRYRSIEERRRFMDVIKMFVHPDPRKRPSPTKARTMLMTAIL